MYYRNSEEQTNFDENDTQINPVREFAVVQLCIANVKTMWSQNENEITTLDSGSKYFHLSKMCVRELVQLNGCKSEWGWNNDTGSQITLTH